MANDITGYWQTESGCVYHFSREDEFIVATIYRPTAYQTLCGIKPADLVFKGTLVGKVLVGVFQQRCLLSDKERCPGAWLASSTLYLQVSDSFDLMTGDCLIWHIPDNSCEADDRRLDVLTFKPATPEEKVTDTSGKHKHFTSGG
jgi:hypothetical protein